MRQLGFSMIEVLVTMFIVAIGLLGLLGLHVDSQAAELEVGPPSIELDTTDAPVVMGRTRRGRGHRPGPAGSRGRRGSR